MPYTAAHVVEMFQLLLFSGLAFFVLLNLMKRTLTLSLDLDWFYRVFGVWLSAALVRGSQAAAAAVRTVVSHGGGRLIRGLFRHHGPEGILARTWHTSSMAGWIAVLLGVYLLIFFL